MGAEAEQRPRRIVRVIARLNVGGPTMHVVHLVRAMDDGRWRSRLVAGAVPPSEGDMGYYARERGVEATIVSAMTREIGLLRDVRALAALVRIMRDERPDIVHTHTAKAGTLGRLAAIAARVPVRVHTYHGHVLGGGYFPAWKTRLFLTIERWLGRHTDRLVALTETQAREMSEELGVAPRGRFAVVPLGLELARFVDLDTPAARARTRAELDIGADETVIGIVGRLVPVKNHELFLEAVSALRRARAPGVTVLIVGAGEREEELRALAAGLGLAPCVRWLGWRRDLAGLYAAMDAVALTSHDEGTPVALIEAMAAGAPVVARDVGGVREVLTGLGIGTVVPRGAGAETWGEALAAAAARPRLGAHDRARVAERFSVDRLVRDLEALYDEALEGAGSRSP